MLPQLASRWTNRIVALRQSAPLRLLVVDDYRPGAEAITTVLLMEGYDARYASSGGDALELTATWIPDIALLDINMPEMDGFELATHLRRSPRTRHVALVAYTAQDETVTRKPGLTAGFDAYCQKSGSTDVLLRLLARMMQ